MSESREQVLDRAVDRILRENVTARGAAEDIQALREFHEAERPIASYGAAAGMRPGGDVRLAGSIPADVFFAAVRLFPELRQRDVAAMLLQRYPQFRLGSFRGQQPDRVYSR